MGHTATEGGLVVRGRPVGHTAGGGLFRDLPVGHIMGPGLGVMVEDGLGVDVGGVGGKGG